MSTLFSRIRETVQKLKPTIQQPVPEVAPAPPGTEPITFESVVEEFTYPGLTREDFDYISFAEMAATIRKGGLNRLLLYMLYKNKWRHIEPYSFRRGKEGILFFGFDIQANDTRSFYLHRIEQMKLTEIPFAPRWLIEL